ncbi:hypothetical protein C7I55_07950 [Sphingomonas deserti]|uniref:Uncharacterized protein n=1 Tax=Allosphingosinicella deserti TaxID=2116704 RepID=A0A2P7QW11_9SPHN|nr:hypothetical protein C7I55_07950 [Sphingomonas deserti]
MSSAPNPAQDPIQTFLPWANEDERKLRQRLLKAQTYATGLSASATSTRAQGLYRLIVTVAGERAFAPASCDELKDTADGLVRLLMVAQMFERTEGAHG